MQLLPLPGFEPRTSRLAGYRLNHHTLKTRNLKVTQNVIQTNASIQEKLYLHMPLPGFELAPHDTAVLTMIYYKWPVWYEILQIKTIFKISPTEQGALHVLL